MKPRVCLQLALSSAAMGSSSGGSPCSPQLLRAWTTTEAPGAWLGASQLGSSMIRYSQVVIDFFLAEVATPERGDENPVTPLS